MTRAAATTRFLLGRRGRHLYPLRSPQILPSIFDSTSSSLFSKSSSSSSSNHNSNNNSPTGRHGVPPPKQGWNCKKQHQPYAYGFPITQTTPYYYTTGTAGNKSWITSPVVLITLLLLSGCFVGAYCLVLRIDQSLQDTLQPNSNSGSKFPTAAAALPSSVVTANLRGTSSSTSSLLPGSSSKSSLIEEHQHHHVAQSLPLYLNLTIYQIPCDELTVEVSESESNNSVEITDSENKDRLIFKSVPSTTTTSTSSTNFHQTTTSITRRSLAKEQEEELPLRHQSSVNTDHREIPPKIVFTDLNKEAEARQLMKDEKEELHRRLLQDIGEESEGGRGEGEGEEEADRDGDDGEEDEEITKRQGEDEEQEEERGGSLNGEEIITGCQIMGHLQLPMIGTNHQQQPAIVSFRSDRRYAGQHQQQINLSHRIDLLRIGSNRSFPKEESMFLNKFRPHLYTEQHDGDSLVTHRYNVYDNFHLVEQESIHQYDSSSSTVSSAQRGGSEDGEGAGGHEIQLVFTTTKH